MSYEEAKHRDAATTVEELQLPGRVTHCLREEGIDTVADLMNISFGGLRYNTGGIGERSYKDIVYALLVYLHNG